LSNGEQRKAAILLAFAARPEVLLLDEPAGSFDLVARRELIEQIVDAITQSEGCTVLLSTHLISDLERIADFIGVMDRGRMAMSVRLEDLLNETRRVQVIFEEDQPPEHFEIVGALRTWRSGSVVNAIVRWSRGDELETLKATLTARVQVFPTSLEEIFIELFGEGIREQGDQEIKRNGNGALRRL
jgi:ABC-type multidrug transport system ATPase subunit